MATSRDLREMVREEYDVVAAFPQRRKMHRNHVQPEEQVLAEAPVADGGSEVHVRGGDQAQIDLPAPHAAEAPNRPVFQDLQQLHLEVEGEMHADAALSEDVRRIVMPNSPMKGAANLLVFPDLDSANITLNVLKVGTDALHVGPILLGTARPAHILTPSVTSRGVVNMTALAVVQCARHRT